LVPRELLVLLQPLLLLPLLLPQLLSLLHSSPCIGSCTGGQRMQQQVVAMAGWGEVRMWGPWALESLARAASSHLRTHHNWAASPPAQHAGRQTVMLQGMQAGRQAAQAGTHPTPLPCPSQHPGLPAALQTTPQLPPLPCAPPQTPCTAAVGRQQQT
jgi:hypothetical protein